MGYRGRWSRRTYPGNGPYRDVPPWQRPGWIYGEGAGATDVVDSYSCMRYPWLPRRWWAYSEAMAGVTGVPSAEQTKRVYEQQIAVAEKHIATLHKKLNEADSGEKAK